MAKPKYYQVLGAKGQELYRSLKKAREENPGHYIYEYQSREDAKAKRNPRSLGSYLPAKNPHRITPGQTFYDKDYPNRPMKVTRVNRESDSVAWDNPREGGSIISSMKGFNRQIEKGELSRRKPSRADFRREQDRLGRERKQGKRERQAWINRGETGARRVKGYKKVGQLTYDDVQNAVMARYGDGHSAWARSVNKLIRSKGGQLHFIDFDGDPGTISRQRGKLRALKSGGYNIYTLKEEPGMMIIAVPGKLPPGKFKEWKDNWE